MTSVREILGKSLKVGGDVTVVVISSYILLSFNVEQCIFISALGSIHVLLKNI